MAKSKYDIDYGNRWTGQLRNWCGGRDRKRGLWTLCYYDSAYLMLMADGSVRTRILSSIPLDVLTRWLADRPKEMNEGDEKL